ncbi:CDP-glycerol glycerophosphotransferase [Ornithinibacillus gellani]|uniref:CDP-glycerol glycerophosphotransferase family protein n=1 Tax=Ornithinibacillus gellani TaxID=2293253 RepID=UPI000F46D1EA|nr:CDP-glycerol glycerophosphotransferase family protein [Ornithinibacillus gellani]TQS71262.1 CDP-glycerol glycerophosphotransferase [Ornithinibacillus gellani]
MQFFKKKSNKKRLKQSLVIQQKSQNYYIHGNLNNSNYQVRGLYFVSRTTDIEILIKSKKQSNYFEFDFSLNEFQEELFVSDEEDIYDLYLHIRVYTEDVSKNSYNKLLQKSSPQLDEAGKEYIEYQMRFGRFQESIFSKLDVVSINGNTGVLYKTVKGNLSFAVNKPLSPSTKTQINHLKFKHNQMFLDGRVFTKNSWIESCHLLLKGRETGKEVNIPVTYEQITEDVKRKFGLNRYYFQISFNLDQVFEQAQLEGDIYDLFFVMDYNDISEPIMVRVGKPRFWARFRMKSSFARVGNQILSISPYYTIKYKNLSLQVDEFAADTYRYLKRIMRWYWILRPFYWKKDIWVVGERPYKAQDTGYRFFKYMREKHPDKQVYYVIESDSPELKNVKPYGNTLIYKSKKHILYTLMARRIIGSHHPDYLYPLRTDEFKHKVKGLKVFIQHGVIGTKNVIHFYGKNSNSFDTDLFLVSSDFEKKLIINDFGYYPSEVKVTGLSRFDSLFEQDIPLKQQLLIIPTWREWLVNDEQFLESDYLRRYQELVNDPALHQLASQYGFEIVFCLHPNMQRFTHYFKDSPVKVISQGEVDVQDLLKESAMMITDYSSVAFDFSFLNKPIIYYQFDRKRYIGKKGSHLNLDEDLPGEIVYEESDIISLVKHYAKSAFMMKDLHIAKADKFLKYKDQKSSERIYRAVSNAKGKKFVDKLRQNEIIRTIFRRWRKSKYYFPMMKLFYRLAKRFTKVDKNLIVFESGIGKQYADSPRFVYEEIVSRKLNYRKVWIHNKNVRFDDTNTISVKRLSPRYYYYLAKAGYWVNNQNFPTYLKKRPQTTYLQTWHGTPLKKMLYDIEEVHGRSDDYVERVGNAVKNWDYLVSPSSYATKAFRSAFHYNGEVLEVGYPRNDIFYQPNQEEMKERIRNKLGIPADKKIILYAPTFRDDQKGKKNRFAFELEMDIQQMQERLADDYVLLLRMHVVVSSKLTLEEEWEEFAHNVSNYPDMQELLLISDVLITDYSSVMFDFANTSQPMLFFTYDLEHYRDSLRGFYMDLEAEAPGPLVYNTEEIVTSIENIAQVKQTYEEKYTRFRERFCGLEDGHATKRVVDAVFHTSNGKK